VLVLWDIDQTLIDAGQMDRRIWTTIASELLGTRPVDIEVVPGTTISTILRAALITHGADPEAAEQLLGQALQSEIEALEDLARTRSAGRVLPGAFAAMGMLSMRPGTVQSILTGNQKQSAALKLKAFGLDRGVDLDVGAYGSDAEHRPSLVPLARRRTAQKYGAPTAEPTVLIGDSVRDVQAATENSVPIVAVASGTTSADALADAGADAVLPDLTHRHELETALTRLSRPVAH
jgi:phosphoglycolate phosphatase